MKATKDYIKNELTTLYSEGEIRAFIRQIFESVCGMSLEQQILNSDTILDNNAENEIKAIIERLKKHEPLQYIFGKTEFYSLPMLINPAVLIPRPETEELIDIIIKRHKNNNQEIRVLDIGTGSGCIAIALKKHISNCEVFAIDISEAALQTARQNAATNNTEITFINVNILNNSDIEKKIKAINFDVIVSNPPYVTKKEKQSMQNNVLDYEPHSALFVPDSNPLLYYKAISRFAVQYLKNDGELYFEINPFYAAELSNFLSKSGFNNINVLNDLSGKKRFVYCSL